jgi:DNA-binding transcriptional ArsR family regulator
MSGGASALDWGVLVPRLIHETKVWIVEAMRWIDRPLSARELERISGGRKSISTFEHHLLSLVKAGGVKRVSRQRIRGAHESHYFFTEAVRRPT